MEAAVRDAIAGLPGGMAPRIAMISDGRENQGSVARARMARPRPAHSRSTPSRSPGRPQPLLRIESSFAPAVAFTGEKFPIDLVVSSPKPASGSVELTAEGKRLGRATYLCEPAATSFAYSRA